MRRIFILLSLILALFLTACKNEEKFEFKEVSIDLYVGEEVLIPYEGLELEFVSSNDSVEIIGSKIRAKGIGVSIITPKDEKYKNKQLVVNVIPVFKFNFEELNVTVGSKVVVDYFLLDGYTLEITTTNNYITYENGVITGITPGESKLSAKVTKDNYIYVTSINVIINSNIVVLEEIVITGINNVKIGETIKLSYTLIPNTYEKVNWSSSDESVISVNSFGYVTAHKVGVATITASVGDISKTHEITVIDSADINYVDLYYVNDLHGAIERENNSLGLAYIANFIDKRREENPNTLLLAGGDMLQGQAMSNYYYGTSTLTIMELMGFDAMAIGNHEFDWGLKKVTDKFDKVNGIVSFPLLGINVREKATNQIPENILPYVMIEKPDVKIGVIGVIGEYLESSIAYNMVKDYEFINPRNLIKDAARTLRENGADFVIVVIHDDNDSLNDDLSMFSGKERIDAIFTAHSHMLTATTVNGVPVIQSRHNGEYVGHIRLHKYGSHIVENINYHEDLNTPNLEVQQQIEIYKAETDPIFNKVIIKNRNMTTDREELSSWIARLMRNKTGADIGFHNYGGTRTYINANENITLKKLYQIWPFDNVVKTVKLKGAWVKLLMDNTSLVYDTDVVIEDDKEYLVATNDYVFDHEGNQYIFNQGTQHTNTELLLRDLAEEELTRQSEIYDYFDPNNPFIITYFYKEDYIFVYL
ncbi:MAG: hypothetical protein GX931_03825 [Acholeplasmataceae bacterium]|nr:hypothetical protein [Acholeplasmataceae bacterium]